MQLSDQAKILLNKDAKADLQSLAFDELVDEASLQRYQEFYQDPIAHLNHSLKSSGLYPHSDLTWWSIDEAVVLSSGRIYSKNFIVKEVFLIHSYKKEDLKCPISGQVLRPVDGDLYFIPLPEFDNAVNAFRQSQARAENTKALLTAEPVKIAPGVRLKVLVDACKIRIIIGPVHGGSNFSGWLKDFFSMRAFPGNPRSEIPVEATSYHVENFGRCWSVSRDSARLEFWFPSAASLRTATVTNSHLTHDELTRLLSVLSTHLGDDTSCRIMTPPIGHLEPHKYVEVLSTLKPISSSQLETFCLRFLEKTQEIIQLREYPNFEDIVIPVCSAPTMGLFRPVGKSQPPEADGGAAKKMNL